MIDRSVESICSPCVSLAQKPVALFQYRYHIKISKRVLSLLLSQSMYRYRIPMKNDETSSPSFELAYTPLIRGSRIKGAFAFCICHAIREMSRAGTREVH